MYYSQSTIDGLLEEHVAIRGQMKLVLDMTQEWKEILALMDTSNRNPERLNSIAEKRTSLGHAMSYLRDGLINHHVHEDNVLPSLIGEILMEAIRVEHNEMMRRLQQIDAILVNPDLEVFLSHATATLLQIEEMSNLTRTHSAREDGILYFLKNVPEKRANI